MENSGKKFIELIEIMARLRGPDGCPWDKEQSYKDIAAHTLEETYEVLQTIDLGNYDALREELGDLILQVVFYAQIASEEGRFTISDVLDGITKKLIHRHPHVFGDCKVSGAGEVLRQWEQLKKKEGKKTVLGGVPTALPALLKAFRIGEKTSRVGFDWPDVEGILAKVDEEAKELHEAKTNNDKEAVDHEYGDLLFTLANLGRFLGLDPEGSLRRATERFTSRFNRVEEYAGEEKVALKDLSAQKWDELWERAKSEELK